MTIEGRKCERCGATQPQPDSTDIAVLDFCGTCGADLCDGCMAQWCCERAPAASGLEAADEDDGGEFEDSPSLGTGAP
jgi:hypothetical protein